MNSNNNNFLKIEFFRKFFFVFYDFLIEFIGVTLVNKIIQVSEAQVYNTSSVHCTVCSPPQVKSPFITIYLPIPSSTTPTPPSLW